MTDSGFEVDAATLRAHAAVLDEVAALVADGRSAAATVSIGRGAYGMMCQIIPSLLDPLQDLTITALQEATDSLQTSADDLRVTARDYTSSDDRTASVFRGGPGR